MGNWWSLISFLLYTFTFLSITQLSPLSVANPVANVETYDLFNDEGTPNHRSWIRIKRFVVNKRRWAFDILTWKLHNDNINAADRFVVRNTLHRAFTNWAAVSSLRFVEIPVENPIPADINIVFLRGGHGDSLPFDGPEGVVAHAFYPTRGVLHFDADENWTLNQMQGINLYQTAVHEIGHLLGLEHSTDKRAVMYPQNRKFDSQYGLADDDVRGIRRLYPPVADSADFFMKAPRVMGRNFNGFRQRTVHSTFSASTDLPSITDVE